MVEVDHVRLGRIADKLAAARAMPVPPKAFGVEADGFKLAAPSAEAAVAEFEEWHEVTRPLAYRLFVTELGDGGAGPGYGLRHLARSCCARRRSRSEPARVTSHGMPGRVPGPHGTGHLGQAHLHRRAAGTGQSRPRTAPPGGRPVDPTWTTGKDLPKVNL